MENFKKPLEEMIRGRKVRSFDSFFIKPLESGKSIISLDNEGTEYEIYHNQYSKSEISEALNSNRKVKNYKYSNLGGLSNTLLKINIKK